MLFVDEERLERVVGRHRRPPGAATTVVVQRGPGAARSTGAPSRSRVRTVDFNEFVGEIDRDATPPDVDIATDDDVTMFYTSGTTGQPKGAVGTHRNAISNLMNLFFAGYARSAALRAAPPDPAGRASQSAGLLSVPLFHATGCLASMITNTARRRQARA